MNKKLTYKNYYTIINYNVKDKVFYGKIEGITDLVNFEGKNMEGIEQAFQDAVNDYISVCKSIKRGYIK